MKSILRRYCFLIVFAEALHVFSYETGSVNFTFISELYSSVCGRTQCDEITEKNESTKLLFNDSFCGSCSCDRTCFVSGNCCPELFFKYKPKCIETKFMSLNSRLRYRSEVLMVSQCPTESDSKVREKCEKSYDLVTLLQKAPITLPEEGLTFRNVHCLECFNKTLESSYLWTVKLECEEVADFNYLSSYSSYIALAKKKRCNLLFHTDTIDLMTGSCPFQEISTDDVISSCNISKTWETYNSDIDYACQTYDNRFHFFKNIYCYICNPPIQNDNVITECNITGNWDPLDVDLENDCLQTIRTPVTGPYSNIHCYYCNRNNTQANSSIIFGATLNNSTYTNGNFMLQFNQMELNYESVKKIGIHLFTGKGNDSGTAQDFIKRSVNVTHNLNTTVIFSYYSALTGRSQSCSNAFEQQCSCDCSEHCHFNKEDCCFERFLDTSLDCTHKRNSVDGIQYLVYDECSYEENAWLTALCKSDDENHLYSVLPVEYSYQNYTVQYKNIYCYFCNKNTSTGDMNMENENINTWDLLIRCQVFLPIFFLDNIEDYLTFAIQNSCDMFFEPFSFDVSECAEPAQCNSSGISKYTHPDITFVCNSVNLQFRETPFCSICNPSSTTEPVYSRCNVTGQWEEYDKEIENNCLNLPKIEYHLPFKNYFCKQCNGNVMDKCSLSGYDTTTTELSTVSTRRPPIFNKYSFRAMFDFYNYKNQHTQTTSMNRCNVTQIPDPTKNKCIDLMCYPGRILTIDGCKPLLKITNNIGYILSLGMKTELSSNINETLVFLQSAEWSLKNFLYRVLQINRLNFISSILLPHVKCKDDLIWKNGTEIKISIYQDMYIPQEIDRSRIEDKLLSIQNSNFTVLHDSRTHNFIFYSDPEAIHIQSYISQNRISDSCYLQVMRTTSSSYSHSYVNELLSCEQIELETSEFNLHAFKLVFLGIELDSDEYAIMTSGKARICANTFRKILINYKTSQKNVWDIIHVSCTCLSLIIDTFLPLSAFSTFISILNGVQGIFIFWSFICNKRVLNLYRSMFRPSLGKTANYGIVRSRMSTISTELQTMSTREQTY
ncbi:unnamed protein product [Mytilus coruscus]|uniref:SMB domain-containing protein n=1 Tax=Mytilus coruscus TaxID=42192 RepID=A0A6J8DB07_MYTCO|nr:unnamed protein product [Mytilus coruscus]